MESLILYDFIENVLRKCGRYEVNSKRLLITFASTIEETKYSQQNWYQFVEIAILKT